MPAPATIRSTFCARYCMYPFKFMNHDVMRKSCTFKCGPHALEHHENPSSSQHRFLPVLPSKLWPRQVQRLKWNHQSQKQKDHNMAQNLGTRTNAHDSHTYSKLLERHPPGRATCKHVTGFARRSHEWARHDKKKQVHQCKHKLTS